jgi:hypothetical protein
VNAVTWSDKSIGAAPILKPTLLFRKIAIVYSSSFFADVLGADGWI